MAEWTRQVPKFNGGPRFAHASCVVDKTIFVFGGQKKGYLDDLWAWDCAGDEWITFTPQGKPPTARVQHTACFTGKEVLVFGGYVENIAEENDLYALDVLNPEREFTWTPIEAKGERPPKRYGHTATMVGERMVVIAGQDSMAQLHDVWVLNCATYTWTSVTCGGDVMLPCALHSATYVDGHGIVVLGGFNRKLRNTGSAFALQLDAKGSKATWKNLHPKDPASAFGRRSQHRVVAQSSHLIIFGGYDGAEGAAAPTDSALLAHAERQARSGKGRSYARAKRPAEQARALSMSTRPRSRARAPLAFPSQTLANLLGDKTLNDISVFDLATLSFKKAEQRSGAPEPRSRHTLELVGSTLYCMLGYKGEWCAGPDVFSLQVGSETESIERILGAAGGGGKEEEEGEGEEEDESEDERE